MQKNKIKKIIPYLLVLAILVGVFSPLAQVRAQATDPVGTCNVTILDTSVTPAKSSTSSIPSLTNAECNNLKDTNTSVSWVQDGGTAGGNISGGGDSLLYQNTNAKSCGVAFKDATISGCVQLIFYFIFYQIPSFLLSVAGNFFDAMIGIALKGDLISGSTFVTTGWGLVRDLSNIFFIMILLYIAIQMILGIGGHNTKKMIANIIIMALLINFSMFFTEVIIDSSNVLALIFYNKLSITTQRVSPTGTGTDPIDIPYQNSTKYNEKDIAGAMVNSFDPTRFMSQAFFDSLRIQPIPVSDTTKLIGKVAGGTVGTVLAPAGPVGALAGYQVYKWITVDPGNQIPTGEVISIIVISGAIMLMAVYCFLVAALAFLDRIVELWMLIIFSPFAFMSSSVPFLEKFETIGWHEWMKRVIKLSFMAPIFMFFIYLIFLLIRSNIFTDWIVPPKDQGFFAKMILFILPAAFILILLYKATEYAKESSGKLAQAAESLVKGAGELALGVAVGGAIGGVAAIGQGTLGHMGKGLFESKTLQNWETNEEKGVAGWSKRKFGSALRTLGGGDTGKGGLAGSSFDFRQGVGDVVMSSVSTATGINLGAGKKFFSKEAGGYEADLERRAKKMDDRAKGLELKEGEPEKQALNKAKDDHMKMKIKYAEELEKIKAQMSALKEKAINYRNAAAANRRESQRIKNDPENYNKNFDNGKGPDGKQLPKGKWIKNEDKWKAAEAKYVENQTLESQYNDKITALEAKKGSIKNGGKDEKTGKFRTHNENMTKDTADGMIANEAEDRKKAIAARKKAMDDPSAVNLAEEKEATRLERTSAAMADAARAMKAVTAAEEARARLLRDPRNETLRAESKAAEEAKRMAEDKAEMSAREIEDIARTDKAYVNAAGSVRKLTKSINLGLGNTMNDYEDEVLPHLEHQAEHVTKRRQWALAGHLERKFAWPWNEAARKKSAHKIRQGIHEEGGDHGGHGGKGGVSFGQEVAAELVGSAIEHAVSGPADAGHGDHAGH